MMQKISKATLQRYPLYLKALEKLAEQNVERIMSRELAEYVGIEPTTIRRDFSLIGHLGKQGYGYEVKKLIEIFSNKLGINLEEKIVLIGAGNLGKALLNYNHWPNVVGKIVCAFDKYPQAIKDLKVPVYDIRDLKTYLPQGTRVALLCMSADIQTTVDKLAECGIRGFVDLTHEHFVVPKGCLVRYVDIVSTIIEIVFETNNLPEKEEVC